MVALAIFRSLYCLSKAQDTLQVGLKDESLSKGNGIELSHPIISWSIFFLFDIFEDDDLAEVIGLLTYHCLTDEEIEQFIASLQFFEDEWASLMDVDSTNKLENPNLEHYLHF